MSKKIILPIVALLGASSLVVGFSNETQTTEKKEAFINHINSFENEVNKYISASAQLNTTALNKYNLSLKEEHLDDIENSNLQTLEEPMIDESLEENTTTDDKVEIPKEDIEEISTLYSLSEDIENSCDEFCELKKEVSTAIIETQSLINKLQNKEVELNNEQRLFITEQAQQLKNLGRQLASVTTELSFNLSDLNQIMLANNNDIDSLSLKYLVVLDNLVNGNEMLQSGLSSLNMINQMLNLQSNTIPSNNQGRLLYGFQQNNNPPVLKDYYLNENGEWIENESHNTKDIQEGDLLPSSDEKNNIDTYSNNNLKTNLDTYKNNNLSNNIDTFFNTALLDNEFMYGNNYGYGMNGPMMNNPYNRNYNNTLSSDTTDNHTQNIEKKKNKKSKKRFELKKNIDTFKDENEPDIKTKLSNIKNSISNFFGVFQNSDLDDKIENPITRLNED